MAMSCCAWTAVRTLDQPKSSSRAGVKRAAMHFAFLGFRSHAHANTHPRYQPNDRQTAEGRRGEGPNGRGPSCLGQHDAQRQPVREEAAKHKEEKRRLVDWAPVRTRMRGLILCKVVIWWGGWDCWPSIEGMSPCARLLDRSEPPPGKKRRIGVSGLGDGTASSLMGRVWPYRPAIKWISDPHSFDPIDPPSPSRQAATLTDEARSLTTATAPDGHGGVVFDTIVVAAVPEQVRSMVPGRGPLLESQAGLNQSTRPHTELHPHTVYQGRPVGGT